MSELDGYRSTALKVSTIKELRRIGVDEGYSSLPKVVDYLIAYYKEPKRKGV